MGIGDKHKLDEEKKQARLQEYRDVRSAVKRPMTEDEPKLELTWRRFVRMGFHVFRQIDDPYYAGFAAQIAYYFFMSIVPTLILLTQMLGLFDVSLDAITSWMQKNMGQHMSAVVSNLFNASSVKATNFLMAIIALWSASSLVFSLSRLFCYTLSNGRYRFSFFKERIRAIPIALLSTVIIAGAIIVLVYGEIIFKNVFGETYLVEFLLRLSWPGYLFLFFVMAYEIYMILPRFTVPPRSMLPGACVAAFGLLIITDIYSKYIDYATNYNILYGSFANIIAMLLWFYLLSWVIELGMMFNKSWDIYMARGRLSPKKIREYILESLDGDESRLPHYYYSESLHIDRTVNTIAVNLSKYFVDGFAEARDTFPDKYDGAPDRERDS